MIAGEPLYLLAPKGAFKTSTERVAVTQAVNNTAEPYVELALLLLGGASCELRVVRESWINTNVELQQIFTSALTQIKLREIRAIIESCLRCGWSCGVTRALLYALSGMSIIPFEAPLQFSNHDMFQVVLLAAETPLWHCMCVYVCLES